MTADHGVQTHLFGHLLSCPFRQKCAEILSTLPHFTLASAGKSRNPARTYVAAAFNKTNSRTNLTVHSSESYGSVEGVLGAQFADV